MNNRNPFLSLCEVTKPDNTIPPEFSVCRVFKYIRLIKNMTLQKISELQTLDGKGIGQLYLSEIELMRTTPTFETAHVFCALTKIDPTDFYDCVSKTMYMTNQQAAEYIGKRVLKILIDESDED